ASWLAKNPALEDVTRMTQEVAKELAGQEVFPTWFELTEASLQSLKAKRVPIAGLKKLQGQKYTKEAEFLEALATVLPEKELATHRSKLLEHGRVKVEAVDALAVKESLLPWLFSQ